MSMRVSEQIISRRTNGLDVKLNIAYYDSNTYRQSYTPKVGLSNLVPIDDRVAFHAKFFEYKNNMAQYLIKFIKIRKNDNLMYKINHSYSKEDGSNTIKNEFLADDRWHSVTDVISTPGAIILNLNNKIAPSIMSFANIHEDTDYTDFQLRGVDGSVHMHKVVAAACSPFFKTLFSGTWRETADGIVNVPDTSVATLQQLKEYMYLGTVPESQDLNELLLLSSCYMMPDLEMRCAYEMCKQVTKETAHELIQFAVKHNMSQLLFEVLLLVQQGKLDVNEIKNIHKP